jgi:hypothetical protein
MAGPTAAGCSATPSHPVMATATPTASAPDSTISRLIIAAGSSYTPVGFPMG